MADILPINSKVGNAAVQTFDPLEALQNIPLVTFVVDETGAIVFANIAAEHFFLISNRQLKANGLGFIFSDEAVLKNHIKNVVESQGVVTLRQFEIEQTPRAKTIIDLNLTSFNSLANSNKPLVLLTINNSQMEHDSVDKNANNVASLADMLAHEVKNPLSGIRGAAQLLEQNAQDEDKKLTQIICQECDRIRLLVESMESFSDSQAFEFAGVNIHHSLDHVLGVAKAGFASNINIQTIYDPSLPLVRANHDALVQVLLNLVKNSAESIAMSDNAKRGEIIIKTAYSHGGAGSSVHNKSTVQTPIEITIHDNGTGIGDELLDTLFEPFVTRKKVGKGLGLALVQKLLNSHQARIFAENTATGAQFKLYLPIFRGELDE